MILAATDASGPIIGAAITIGLSLLGVAWKLGMLAQAVKDLGRRVGSMEHRSNARDDAAIKRGG